ncbi:hypothetical protein CHS0354_032240 [Potamilus streckersoni]|uniref:Oligomycin sensitivity conferral protein n=1 Tax=Potamilus streckersoni TaxID=2493646 RepID=A0AAE0RPS3_9BIVA|nr:hypothetical protein CHS0354_032240 [Potamilus streckersoni]
MASFRTAGQLVRQFSSSAVRHKLVYPPIQVYGVEGRYATALFSAASKEKKLDAVEKELDSLRELMKKDVRFTEFLLNPSLKRKDKIDTLRDAMAKQKFSSLTTNLLATMAENGRLKKIGSVFTSFDKLMSAVRGEIICTVTTAKPLDAAGEKELRSTLQEFVKKEEKVNLEMRVDPSIIGGMIVSIGDKYVDMSMATKIKTYTNLIKEAV